MKMLCVILLVLALQDDDVERARKVIRPAEAFKAASVEFDKETQAKISKVIGESPGKYSFVKAKAQLMFAEDPELQEIRIGFVTFETAKGKVTIGVAIAPKENMLAAVKVLSGPKDLLPEDSIFLSQFEGLVYSPASVGMPPSALKEMREKAKKDKTLAALFGMRDLMDELQVQHEELMDMISDNDEETEAKFIKFMDLMEKTNDHVKDTGFIKNPDRIQEKLIRATKRANAVLTAIREKNWAKASKEQTNLLIRGCNSCHTSYQRLYREKRDELGIGTGYFKLGHDLFPEEGADEKVMNQIGAAIKKAVLLLSEAK